MCLYFCFYIPDPNDNMLTIKCRSDKKFDVPVANDMPECLAQCPQEKPEPPAENNIIIDEERTPMDRKLWENEKLW